MRISRAHLQRAVLSGADFLPENLLTKTRKTKKKIKTTKRTKITKKTVMRTQSPVMRIPRKIMKTSTRMTIRRMMTTS